MFELFPQNIQRCLAARLDSAAESLSLSNYHQPLSYSVSILHITFTFADVMKNEHENVYNGIIVFGDGFSVSFMLRDCDTIDNVLIVKKSN